MKKTLLLLILFIFLFSCRAGIYSFYKTESIHSDLRRHHLVFKKELKECKIHILNKTKYNQKCKEKMHKITQNYLAKVNEAINDAQQNQMYKLETKLRTREMYLTELLLTFSNE